MSLVRIYGNSIGNSSFARVAAGMRWALSEMGLLAGFVPVDSYSEDDIYPGHDAEHAVLVGHPSCVSMMTGIGWHKKRWALLPANSSWMPRELIESMSQHVTGFIAPSKWAQGVLRRYTDLEVSLWRHGVVPEFTTNEDDKEALIKDYRQGRFEVAHLASTTMQRKGTRELVLGWGQAVKAKKLGLKPILRMIVDGPHDAFKKEADESGAAETIVWSRNRWNMSVEQAAHFYRKHHLVCQPSRGEGFGLCLVESLACGVPVAATACTGHSEFMLDSRTSMSFPPPGAVCIVVGSDAPIDDGPGAMAPSLSTENVVDALAMAYEHWPTLMEDAQKNASMLRSRWNWTETTKQWLTDQKLGEKREQH